MKANAIRRLSVAACVAALLVAPTVACESGPSTPAEKEAVAAAQAWLKLTDGGKYKDSWAQAASYFRKALQPPQWEQQIRAVRSPLGQVLSRKVKSATSKNSLPGAPDGKYVIIQFTTTFAHKKGAIETVTPMKDDDGVWRVSGYFIK